MWYQFLERISLIDSVDVADTTNPDLTKTVRLQTLQLGQLRQPGNELEGERLNVRWYLGGVEQGAFRDQFVVNATSGSWTVQVELLSPEVRDDPQNLLKESEAFTV